MVRQAPCTTALHESLLLLVKAERELLQASWLSCPAAALLFLLAHCNVSLHFGLHLQHYGASLDKPLKQTCWELFGSIAVPSASILKQTNLNNEVTILVQQDGAVIYQKAQHCNANS